MDNNIDNLRKLIEKIKTIGFFDRIFNWQKIKEQLVDAVADLQKIISNAENLNEINLKLEATNSGLSKDLELSNANNIKHSGEIENYKILNKEITDKLNNLNSDLSARDVKIENFNQKIIQLETSNMLLAQKNEQLSADNQIYSETAATNKEALNKITERKNQLENSNGLLSQRNDQLIAENKIYSEENAKNIESISKITERKNQLEIDIVSISKDLATLQDERDILKQKNIQHTAEEDNRKIKFENDMATLNSIKEQIQNDRNKELEERNSDELERIKKLKETWSKHQEKAKGLIKNICNKHTIEYIDKVPFRGEPDNTLRICDEFVIFDSKSPATDDLTNFPNYLKDQAEKAKKYARQEGVKADIFFVVPSNTLEKLSQFVFNLADYNVFVISVDSLEQIILSLKKIEEYEFAEQLSPEERDNICRVLGKFAHLTKRRIQIDSFFAKQFIELAYKSESDLPKDIFEKVVSFEKSEKLNPPIEKRAKVINIKELEKETEQLNNEASAKGIEINDIKISSGINELQLYKNDTSK